MLACIPAGPSSLGCERVGISRNILLPTPRARCALFDTVATVRSIGLQRTAPWAVALLMLLSAISIGWAQAPSRESELESIRDQIMVLRSRLNRVRQEAGGLRGDLRETEVALELQNKRLEEARTARALAEESLAAVESDIESLERDLEELRELLRRRMIDLHRLGQQGYARLFLSIRSQEDLLPGIRQMRYLVKRDGGLLAEYQQTYGELSAKQSQLVEHREEVREWLQAEATRLGQLERLENRLSTLIARLESEDQRLSEQTTRLADKERKLANLIDFLYGRTEGPLSGTPAQNFRGVLDWPVSGSVTSRFGPRLDPQYGTQVPHNGIDLRVNTGSEVQVVYPGKVLYAAPFQGFGLTAIVHHPGRVFSLYAGMQELRVRQNAVVSLGQVIGLSTDSLYFEIRVENRPVDPLQWLR